MKHSFRCDAETALVRTDRGLVKGYEHDGLLIFKGIPAWPACREGEELSLLIDEQPRIQPNFDHRLIEAHARIMGPVMARMMQQLHENVQH